MRNVGRGLRSGSPPGRARATTTRSRLRSLLGRAAATLKARLFTPGPRLQSEPEPEPGPIVGSFSVGGRFVCVRRELVPPPPPMWKQRARRGVGAVKNWLDAMAGTLMRKGRENGHQESSRQT